MDDEKNKLETVQKEIVKARSLFELTKLLLEEDCSAELVFIDNSIFDKAQKEEAIIKFILQNFWYFLSEILDIISSDNIKYTTSTLSLDDINEYSNVSYEFPRTFYRQRGEGVENISNEYDIEIKKNKDEYILSPPLLESNLHLEVIQSLNDRIVGNVLVRFANTSIGDILGIKINYITY